MLRSEEPKNENLVDFRELISFFKYVWLPIKKNTNILILHACTYARTMYIKCPILNSQIFRKLCPVNKSLTNKICKVLRGKKDGDFEF